MANKDDGDNFIVVMGYDDEEAMRRCMLACMLVEDIQDETMTAETNGKGDNGWKQRRCTAAMFRSRK